MADRRRRRRRDRGRPDPERRGERLDVPREPRRRLPRVRYDPEAFGRVSEAVARFLGTARFLVYLTVFIVAWLAWNTAAPADLQFDPYKYEVLTLVLSVQASYAAPLILLAQNRQDDRDRANLERDRAEAAEVRATMDFLAREAAALRGAVGEVATRDYLRSELSRLIEVVEAAQGPSAAADGPREHGRRGHPRPDDG